MSQRVITCEKRVVFDYPKDKFKVEISRVVFPDDPDDPGATAYQVNIGGNGCSQFYSLKELERYHKAIGYFLDHLDQEGGAPL